MAIGSNEEYGTWAMSTKLIMLGDKSDYHSHADILKTKREHYNKKYDIVKDLPEGSLTITAFNCWKFNDLFYKDVVFYVKCKGAYHKLIKLGCSSKNVKAFDIDGVFVRFPLIYSKRSHSWF